MATNTTAESEVAGLHGMGPKALKLVRAALAANGLSFADSKTEA